VAGLRYINSGEYLVPMDNTITYASPSWAGWQFMLQYSMGMNGDDGVENESSVNRHMAAAIRFDNKTTEFNLVVDSTNWRSFGDKKYGDSPDDSFAVTVGVRHDLGFMKIYGGGHYFQDARSFAQEAYQFYSGTGQHEDVNGADVDPFLSYSFGKDGFSLNIGADYPAMGGTWKVHFGYMDAERSDDSSQKMKRWYAAGGYWYNLSKRSTIYSGISFIQDNLEGGNYDKLDDANAITAGLGLVHTF
jgi:predicted porin